MKNSILIRIWKGSWNRFENEFRTIYKIRFKRKSMKYIIYIYYIYNGLNRTRRGSSWISTIDFELTLREIWPSDSPKTGTVGFVSKRAFQWILEIRNLTVRFGIMSKSNLEKVAVSAVRWPLVEIDCTGLDKIIKSVNNLCKIIRTDLGRTGVKNSIFERIKIYFYRNELVIY